MGVTGLWRLIEPSGKPVPVETLENKVLAVDISIWLHQMVKGYQDARGAPLPNAHLVGLFQRLCKLLYFRIKPVFVFDGGFPELKKETIAKRQDSKNKYNSESQRLKRELALLLSKKSAISTLLGKHISPKKGSSIENRDDDIFKLPDLPKTDEMESESEDDEQDSSSGSIIDLHSVDVNSENFKSLPVREKYDLLVELKETRKMNSWGKLHELPKKSDNFSDFQMQRLLKRRKVQECLQETEKEMGEIGMSINELETLLNEGGIDTKIEDLPTRRIAADDTTRFLFVNNIKDTLNDNTKQKMEENKLDSVNRDQPIKKDELESDLEKAIQMSLECVEEPSTSGTNSKTDDSWTSFITDTDSEGDGFEQPDMSSAKAYIMQYSDFTHKTIDDLVSVKKYKDKGKKSNVDKIIDELNKENSVVVDRISLSSDEYDSGDKCSVPLVPKQEKINAEFFSDTSNSMDNDFANYNKSVDVVDDVVQNNTSDIQGDCPILNSDKEISMYPKSLILGTNKAADIEISDDVAENKGKISFDSDLQINYKEDTENKKSSDSSDDDFEEVEDVESNTCKPVVQLTLNIDKNLEDDIFADIFTDTQQKPIESVAIDKMESGNSINISRNKGPCEKINIQEQCYDSTITIQKTDSAKQAKNLLEEETKVNNQEQSSDKVSKSSNKSENIAEMNDEVSLISEKEKVEVPLDKLNMLAEEIEDKEQNLLQEKGRLDRIGRNITEQMTKEVQELLQIFGIPYIVAPMEAEAQCAFLESVKLTDGTITDDSDIWLFGGSTVYKNFFNQKKHVLQFLSERIEKSYNLSREQLILLALLVGSDYTTGVTGVGPVTALEILASFPFNRKKVIDENSKQTRYSEIVAGLIEFKKWVLTGKKTDNTSLKKKLKNVELTPDFPSIRVVQAYLEPNIEKSEEKFTWGEIDITILRDYTKAKFGWSQNKLDEIIKPVLKRLLERKTQKSVRDYFKTTINYESLEDRMSKRVKAAVQKMGPEGSVKPDANPKKITKKRNKKVISTMDGENEEAGILETKGGISNKRKKGNNEIAITDHYVKVVSVTEDNKSSIEINIPKTDRFQEIIPQRERDKQNLLENKLKAIELFRKTKIDRKGKHKKRIILPKEKAELSESSDGD